jgi:hypothetical protein
MNSEFGMRKGEREEGEKIRRCEGGLKIESIVDSIFQPSRRQKKTASLIDSET